MVFGTASRPTWLKVQSVTQLSNTGRYYTLLSGNRGIHWTRLSITWSIDSSLRTRHAATFRSARVRLRVSRRKLDMTDATASRIVTSIPMRRRIGCL